MSESVKSSEERSEADESKTSIDALKGSGYKLYLIACHVLVRDWLDGKVGTNAPNNEGEKNRILEASKSEGMGRVEDYPEEEINSIVEIIKDKGGLGHIQIAATHRYWIRWTYQFLDICGIKFSGDMGDQVMKHDLSKFSPQEILGYGIMFGGGGQIGFRKIDDPKEEQEWKDALEHHYISNPHHPEFFSPKTKDGIRGEKVVMLGQKDAELYLEESVIDMLASRGERNLREDEAVSVWKWMDVPEVYFKRYADPDKGWVLQKLREWKDVASEFAIKPEKDNLFQGLFGGKSVVA